MNKVAPIGLRAVFLGALVSAALSLANPYTHYVAGAWSIGWGSLPMGVVFALFLLVAANGLVARLPRARAFTRGELLAAYAAGIVTFPLVRMYMPYLLGMLSYGFYRAGSENDWASLIWPHVPSWSRPTGADAVTWFWEGLPQGQALPWRDWAAPMFAWGLFSAAAMGAMFCLAALMSRDWIERQRLTFPLVEVPLALVGDQPTPTLSQSVFRHRVFWVGFAVPAVISVLHWLNRLIPAVPDPTLEWLVGRTLAGMGLPWSVLDDVRIRLYFAVIGVACLIPTEVSLSLWLFYVTYCLTLVVLARFGVTASGGSVVGFEPQSIVGFAEAGGFVALAAAALWQSRGALRDAARGLLGRGPAEVDPDAPLSGRAALFGFLATNAFMLWWAVRAGMSWWTFVLWAGLLYVVLVGCSRLVAAAGVMRVDSAAAVYPFPRAAILRTIGAGSVGPASLIIMTYLSFAYAGDVENSSMPQMMNSFKLLRSQRLGGARLTWGVAVAVVSVLVLGSIALLEVAYRHGATTLQCWPLTGAATCAFRQLDSSLRSPELPSNWLRAALAGGLGITLLLVWLSTRFVWWPVSPVGFVIASSFFTNYGLWFNTFVGWSITVVVRRYGGLKLYRSLRPAFLGLVLGELLTRSALAVLSLLVGLRVPDPFALA